MALQDAIKLIKKTLGPHDKSGANIKRIVGQLEQMNEKELKTYFNDLREGKTFLSFNDPVLNPEPLERKALLKTGRDLGHEWFQRVWFVDNHGNRILKPNTYLITHQPVRRQSQRLFEKMSVPKSNNVVDDLTDQVTGSSKSSSISNAQLQTLRGQGIESAIIEWYKFRGGDQKAFNAMNQSIYRTGEASTDALMQYGGGVKAVRAAHNFFLAMHYENTMTPLK